MPTKILKNVAEKILPSSIWRQWLLMYSTENAKNFPKMHTCEMIGGYHTPKPVLRMNLDIFWKSECIATNFD